MNKDIRKKLIEESDNLVPNIGAKVKSGMVFEKKGREKAPKSSKKGIFALCAAMCVIALAVGIAIPLFSDNGIFNGAGGATVVLSINPKLSIEVGEDNKVTSIKGLNVDGVLIAKAIRQEAVGTEYAAAIDTVLAELQAQGYAQNDREITISAVANNKNRETKLFKTTTDKISNFNNINGTNMKCADNYNQQAEKQAKKYKVTVGHYLLAEQLTLNTSYTIDKAVKLTKEQIMQEIAKLGANNPEDVEKNLDSAYSELKKVYEDKKEKFERQLEDLEKDVEDIIELIEDGKNYTAELETFKLKYPDYDHKGNNDKKGLENYLVRIERRTENQIAALEKRYEGEKKGICDRIKGKDNNNEAIDYDKDFDFDNFDDLDEWEDEETDDSENDNSDDEEDSEQD